MYQIFDIEVFVAINNVERLKILAKLEFSRSSDHSA